MAAAKAAENNREECDLTWYLQLELYTSIPTWTHSQNWLAAVEALLKSYDFAVNYINWEYKNIFK